MSLQNTLSPSTAGSLLGSPRSFSFNKTMRIVALLMVLTNAALANDGVFETRNFRILIEVLCPEGDVSCDNVRYVGTSKKTGNSITLRGETAHTLGRDGVTPSRFLGYRFMNGDVRYFVSTDGFLEVTKGDKVLVHEQGEWKR